MTRWLLLVLVSAGISILWASSCLAQGTGEPTYSESVLYTFCQEAGCADGAGPLYGNLIQGSDGNLYGATFNGGNSETSACQGGSCGTIFRVSLMGVFTTLYTFCSQPNCADGGNPSSLIQGADGNFYGTTQQGGANGYPPCMGLCGAGTIFRLTPAGVLTTLYSFCNQANCADGAEPQASLLQGSDGNFYGTTVNGGANACGTTTGCGTGTVFKFSPSGGLTTLHQFSGADGISPWSALVESPGGGFYGTTSGESGGAFSGTLPTTLGQTVFAISSSGVFAGVYGFCGSSLGGECTDGSIPLSTPLLASDGSLYGTTALGGADSSSCDGDGCGTVFKIGSGGFSTLDSFCDTCTLGSGPQAGLLQASDGFIYGVTITSENQSRGGTVFKLTPSGNASLVYSFCDVNAETACTDGSAPRATLIQAEDGNLYGMTTDGGLGGGTVFKITPSPALGNAATAPIQMTLSQSSIGLGSSVTLTWAVSNAFSLTMQQCNAFVQGGVSGAGVWTGLQSGTLSGGLYSGQATLTPTADGTYTYALTCGGIESGFATLTVGAVAPPPTLSITTTTLPNGTQGQSYSGNLDATGGVAPYTWSIASGSLPAGLSLNGSTGAISGTPSASGTDGLVIQVADSESTPMTATADLTVTIAAPTPTLSMSSPATINISAPGQSGTAVFTVSNFSSSGIAFSCSGLPSGASCSFSSLSGSGNSGSVTLTVMTTAPSSGGTEQATRLAGISFPVLLVVVALSQRRKRDRYFFALILMAGLALNGCGGGGSNASGGGGGNTGTPAGTTTLTVTAAAGGQSAQTTLSLVVQ